MKNRKLKSYLKLGILLFGISLLLWNCEKETTFFEEKELKIETVSQKNAKDIFNKFQKDKEKLQYRSSKRQLEIIPNWSSFNQESLDFTDALLSNIGAKINVNVSFDIRLIFLKANGKLIQAIESRDIQEQNEDGTIKKGNVYFHTFEGKYIMGYVIENNTVIKKLVQKKKINEASLFSMTMFFQEDCDEDYDAGNFCNDELDGIEITSSGGGSSIYYLFTIEWNVDEGGGGGATGEGNGDSGSGGNGDNSSGDDQIINELTDEEKCAFEELKRLELFKTTIKKFENSSNYNLILKSWTNGACNSSTDDGCTDASDLANGNITIYIQNSGRGTLDVAAIILHEGIHAEIFKYVDEHESGLDPNNRANLLDYYFQYKAQNDNALATSNAQHQHMADKYVKPIAQTLRQLDNNQYPLKDYMGLAWDGLRRYGWDGYYDNGNWVTLDRNDYVGDINKVLDNTDFNKDCN